MAFASLGKLVLGKPRTTGLRPFDGELRVRLVLTRSPAEAWLLPGSPEPAYAQSLLSFDLEALDRWYGVKENLDERTLLDPVLHQVVI